MGARNKCPHVRNATFSLENPDCRWRSHDYDQLIVGDEASLDIWLLSSSTRLIAGDRTDNIAGNDRWQDQLRAYVMEAKKVLQIVRALDFAAWAHSEQRRKGGACEPYVNHLTEVARLVAMATGGNDDKLIIAALLHDVLEDQSMHVDYEMLVGNFGKRVANIVREVTDDKSLPKGERKRLQVVHAPHLSRRAKILKIADKSANLNSILQTPPHDWSATRKRKYFAWAAEVVSGCRGVNAWIEAVFDERLSLGRF